MQTCHCLSLLLVLFMVFFTTIILGFDYHNDANTDGEISADQLHIEEDSTSTPMTEPWRMKYNFHPSDRFRRNKISTMPNAVRRPMIHQPNDWKVLSTTSYTIQVGSLVDSAADSNTCNPSTKLSSCNVRSAWALCVSLINQQACGNNAAVSCTVVIPSNTTITMSGANGALDLTLLQPMATNCIRTKAYLSVVGSVTGGLVTWIRGDSTPSPSAFIDAENVPFLTLKLSDINVVGFGDGTVNFLSAVVVYALQASVFQRVSFYDNVGFATGSAVYAWSTGPMLFTACNFINNYQVHIDHPFYTLEQSHFHHIFFLLVTHCLELIFLCYASLPPIIRTPRISTTYQTYVYDGSETLNYGYGFGGAVAIFSATSVSILKTKFINNWAAGWYLLLMSLFYMTFRRRLFTHVHYLFIMHLFTMSLFIVTCFSISLFFLGGFGGGGAVFMDGTNNIYISDRSAI